MVLHKEDTEPFLEGYVLGLSNGSSHQHKLLTITSPGKRTYTDPDGFDPVVVDIELSYSYIGDTPVVEIPSPNPPPPTGIIEGGESGIYQISFSASGSGRNWTVTAIATNMITGESNTVSQSMTWAKDVSRIEIKNYQIKDGSIAVDYNIFFPDGTSSSQKYRLSGNTPCTKGYKADEDKVYYAALA